MKKTLALLLLCALLMGSAPVGQTEAAKAAGTGSLDLGYEQAEVLLYHSAVVFQGRILLTDHTRLVAWQPGDQEVSVLADFSRLAKDADMVFGGSPLLAAGEEGLFVLDVHGGQLFSLDLAGAPRLNPPVEVDTDLLLEGQSMPEGLFVPYVPRQALVQNGRLYILDEGRGGTGSPLYSFDLAKGGAPRSHQAEGLLALSPYGEGLLLALLQEERTQASQAITQLGLRLAILDPVSDSITPLAATDLPPGMAQAQMAYDQDRKLAYVQSGDRVYQVDSQGKSAVCAYLRPASGMPVTGSLQLLSGDSLAFVNHNGISLRGTDPALLPTGRLHILGAFADDSHQAAAARMQGIPVTYQPGLQQSTTQELAQALMAGGQEFDIFILKSARFDLPGMMRKGYCLDLTDQAEIAAYMDGVHPVLRQAGMQDGRILMVPIEVTARYDTQYTGFLEETGLSLPMDYFALCDFLTDWENHLGDSHPDHVPLYAQHIPRAMLRLALRLYADSLAGDAGGFTFQDPLLQQMLKRAQALPRAFVPDADLGFASTLYQKMPLFGEDLWNDGLFFIDNLYTAPQDSGFAYGDNPWVQVRSPLPYFLTATPDTPFRMGLDVSYLAINPKSGNKELALEYLKAYLDSMEPRHQVMVAPGRFPEGVPNPNYDKDLERYLEDIRSTEEALKQAEAGLDRQQLEERLQVLQGLYDEMAEMRRFLHQPQSVAHYLRLLDEGGYVHHHEGLSMILNSPDFSQLFDRYLAGSLSLEALVQEAEGKLRLMRLENE